MNSYQRAFGGLPPVTSSVPTLSTGVPLSARFKQIQITQSHQNQFNPAQYGNQNYSSLSEFDDTPGGMGGMGYANAGPSMMRNQMISRQLAQRQRRAALELQRLRQLTGTAGIPSVRRGMHLRNRIGQQRGFRVVGGVAAGVLRNQMAAGTPFQMKTAGGISGRGANRGRVAVVNKPQGSTGVARGIAGRVGTTAGVARGGGVGARGGRGRNIISTRGGRGGLNGQKTDPPSKEDLDSELDLYMSKTKKYLDSELDDYMAKARAAAATTNSAANSTAAAAAAASMNEPTEMEA